MLFSIRCYAINKQVNMLEIQKSWHNKIITNDQVEFKYSPFFNTAITELLTRQQDSF